MRRLFGTLLCLGLAASSTGCALCYTPYDDAYSAYGGVAPRQDLMHGRVGSILSDPAYQPGPSVTDESVTERDLYPVETGPYLEEIQAQPTPATPET